MYTLIKFEWATVSELMKFHQKNIPFSAWGLGGHSHPWIIEHGQFAKGSRVIEVGGAYSPVPQYIAEKFGCECWVADDFGVESNEPHWSRRGDREELKSKYPLVNYVFERVGNLESRNLPLGYFDVIYSVSTLEYIPTSSMRLVFDHMCKMLKPGGLMMHCVSLPLPLKVHEKNDVAYKKLKQGGLMTRFADFALSLKPFKKNDLLGFIIGTVGYSIYHKYHEIMSSCSNPYLLTMKGWLRFLKNYFKRDLIINKYACNIPNYLLSTINPNIFVEPPNLTFSGWSPINVPKQYVRAGSLVFIISKSK